MDQKRADFLRNLLEQVAEEYTLSNELESDALAPALKYHDWHSREFAAFVCSVLAYGRVEHIKKSINQLLKPMGTNPHQWLLDSDKQGLKRATSGWRHRFNTGSDAYHLLLLLQEIYRSKRSIENFLNISEMDQAKDIIERFVEQAQAILTKNKWRVSKSFWFFFPKPSAGSACKRMNLFLRWMVGKSEQDLNLWTAMKTDKLMIPIDVHILNQAKSLKLTKRKQADWKTVEEVTNMLRILDSNDPTRFDFALCHLGMNGRILS
jgi:uncharacterized protein (TIGR02757 family)